MTILSDTNTIITTGFSAASLAKAINATGPIQDLVGNAYVLDITAKDLKRLATQMKNGMDAGDGVLTNINNILTAIG